MTQEPPLPDFIIAGAMKAGTTSMHHILGQHERVFIPEREIFFFDLDDAQQHPDFLVDAHGNWRLHDFDRDIEHYLKWYRNFFKSAAPGQMIGEDSTTYMASSRAPGRIARLLPNVKLIFMLRDPVTRAYSHYWHLVNTGRAIYDFEGTLRHMPGTILQRGCYKEQIQRFIPLLPDRRLKFIVFEDFIRNMQLVVDDVCRFLDLPGTVDTSARGATTHRNVGRAPRLLWLRLMANRLNRVMAERYYGGYLPLPGSKAEPAVRRRSGRITPGAILGRVARLAPRPKYPPMAEGTHEFLRQFYKKENHGLSELIGIDLAAYWPYMAGTA